MISPPASPTFSPSHGISGKQNTENDNPALSPKRSFAQLDEDPSSQPELKRRDVQASKRTPLDPLSVSGLENRRFRVSQSTDAASYHSNTLLASSSVPDLRVLHPGQPVSSGSCGMQRSGISDALVCSWPPHTPTPGTAGSPGSGLVGRQASQCGALHRLDEKSPSRATFLEPTSTAWAAPNTLQTEPTESHMSKPARMSWKSNNMLQPIRSRTSTPMPSVHRTPGELWRSESRSTKANPEPVDTADPFVYPTPPGLPPRRFELRRSSSSADLLSHGSVSLSLAQGSQPLRASEHMKAVPPIGAERRRVASLTSLKSHLRTFPTTQSHDPPRSPWSPLSHAKWKKETNASGTPEDVRTAAGNVGTSKEDLERLLRHANRSKYAPRIISPLSPLRSATPALDLSADPTYQSRMPSRLNNPSPRYSQCLPKRVRTVCDTYQSLDWSATCVHCQECRRDTVGKRLLASRYRQQQHFHRSQRPRLVVYPPERTTTTASVVGDDRIVLANRIRAAFAYEMDEEERTLWEEVAAVTGAAPVTFSCARTPCSAASRRHIVDDGTDDGYLEIPEEGFLANESATMFREVSVY